MKLKKLKLTNYRNCENITLDLDHEKILIIGKNAQGKTNILESIYFLSSLKSPRTSNIKEFIRFGENNFKIGAELQKSNTDLSLDIEYCVDKTKILKLNGLKTTPKNYKSAFNTVLFSTKDLLLLRGGPQDRRDWLDSAISQIYPIHDERLSKYNKIRIQKNNILKEDNPNQSVLDVFNEQLIITGSNIIFTRQKFLTELRKIAVEKYSAISNTENFSFGYSFPHKDIDAISEALKNEIEQRRSEEFARRQACVGPHRDDIYFYINDKDSTKYASQGQHRTIVLALKLAELELITQKNGTSPVLLLDDVLAELDDLRQNYLLKSISKTTQTIITSVDTLLFEEKFLRNVKIYNISNGAIIQ